MSLDEIKQSWRMSKNKIFDENGVLNVNSVHARFMAEACKKTVINRTCKRITNSSNDRGVYMRIDMEAEESINEEEVRDLMEQQDTQSSPEVVTEEFIKELELEIAEV